MKVPLLRWRSKKYAKLVSETSSESDGSGEEVPLETPIVETPSGEQVPKQLQLDYSRSLSLSERWSEERVERVRQLWDLTPEQVDKLLVLRDRVADLDYWKNDPYEAIRFLREKRDSVDRAETLFRKVYKWRMDNNIDNILDEYKISPIFNYFPIVTLKGRDHDGDPIHLERPAAADCWAFHQRLGSEEIYKMALFMREMDSRGPWHKTFEEEYGYPVRNFTIIIDLQGLSHNHLRPALIAVLGRVLLMSQNQYPFFAKRVIMLRAPRLFKVAWSLAHHFLHDSVKELIVFSTQQDYLQVLDRYMDRSVLPNCICPGGQGQGTLGYEKVKMEGGKPPCHLTDAEIDMLLEEELQHKRSVLVQQESAPVGVTAQPIVRGCFSDSHAGEVVLLYDL